MSDIYGWEHCDHRGIGQVGCPTCDPDKGRVMIRVQRLDNRDLRARVKELEEHHERMAQADKTLRDSLVEQRDAALARVKELEADRWGTTIEWVRLSKLLSAANADEKRRVAENADEKRRVAERVREACAELFRHSWRTNDVTRHEAYERVRGLDLDALLEEET
jgi:uncharacterized Zn finger protein (UPF0148 family)